MSSFKYKVTFVNSEDEGLLKTNSCEFYTLLEASMFAVEKSLENTNGAEILVWEDQEIVRRYVAGTATGNAPYRFLSYW